MYLFIYMYCTVGKHSAGSKLSIHLWRICVRKNSEKLLIRMLHDNPERVQPLLDNRWLIS